MYNLKTEKGRQIFLGLLWRYVNLSQDREKMLEEIGLKRALCLKFFLLDFLESNEESVDEFLKTYQKPYFEKGGVFDELFETDTGI